MAGSLGLNGGGAAAAVSPLLYRNDQISTTTAKVAHHCPVPHFTGKLQRLRLQYVLAVQYEAVALSTAVIDRQLFH